MFGGTGNLHTFHSTHTPLPPHPTVAFYWGMAPLVDIDALKVLSAGGHLTMGDLKRMLSHKQIRISDFTVLSMLLVKHTRDPQRHVR